jgi:hypothetical protein
MQPQEYEELDDKEKVGADPAEVAERRRAMREGAIQGGGEDPGSSKAGLEALPGGASGDAEATKKNSADKKPNLRVLAGGKSDSQSENPQSFLAKLGRRRKLILIGTLGVSITSILVAGFLALIPLKLEFVMKNLEKKEFSSVDNALEKREDALFERYVNKVILKKLDGVTGETIQAQISTGSYASDLFKNWYVGKFEDKLAEESGIKFEKLRGENRKYRIRYANGTAIEFNDEFKYEKLGNAQFRRAMTDAVHEQTKSTAVVRRRYARHLLMKKYGVKRWRLFEDTRDHISDTTFNAKQKVKLALVDKIVGPFSENYATIFKCVISGCKPDELPSNIDANPANVDSDTLDIARAQTDTRDDGGPQSDDPNNPDKAAQAKVDQAHNSVLGAADTSVTDAAENAGDKALADQIKSAFTKELLKKLAGGIGVAEIFYHIDKFLRDDTWRQIIASRNKQQYASAFATYRSAADEAKAGHMSLSTMGALTTNLDGMEESRLYDHEFDLPTNTKQVKCSDGTMLPAGQIVCADKQIVPPAGFAQAYVKSPIGRIIGPIAAIYGGTVHKLVDLLGNVIGFVTEPLMSVASKLVGSVTGFSEKDLADAMQSVLSMFIGPVLTGAETGGALVDGIIAGANVLANDIQHFTLGGVKLTLAQARAVNQQIAQENHDRFQQGSLISRLTNLDNTKSLASRMLASIPLNPISSMDSYAVMATSPFSALSDMAIKLPFSSTFAADDDNPLNNDLYGRPADFNYDYNPEDYSPEKCKAIDEDWVKNHMTKGDALNNCRLELVTTNSAGSMFTKDDDGGISESEDSGDGSSTSSSSGAPLLDSVTGSRSELVDRLLKNPKFGTSSEPANVLGDIRNGIAGDDLVKLLILIVEKAPIDKPIQLSVIKTGHAPCSVSGLTSNHFSGLAADIGGSSSDPNIVKLQKWLFDNAKNLNIDSLIHEPHPSGVTDLRNGDKFTYDAAVTAIHYNHIHVDVNGPHRSAGCAND